eukprot:356599-Chlamydomonas_euryale.AAC.1
MVASARLDAAKAEREDRAAGRVEPGGRGREGGGGGVCAQCGMQCGTQCGTQCGGCVGVRSKMLEPTGEHCAAGWT